MTLDPNVLRPDSLWKIGDWCREDECSDKIVGDSSDCLNLNWGWGWEIGEAMSQSPDVLDVLPSDPFGMNMSSMSAMSAKCSMIGGWIEEVDEDFGYGTVGHGNDELFAGLNWVLAEATRMYPGVDEMEVDGKSNIIGGEIKRESLDDRSEECAHDVGDEGCSGAPPDALFFALGYLGVRDLLCAEKVCKSLRDSVRNDPLLWRSIHIDHPLSETVTDEALLKLTGRACGSLRCLNLVKCFKITDNGIKSVFQNNPGLTKLSVPGCTGLTVEGLLRNIKALKSAGGGGIRRLRISGLSNVTNDQFEELRRVLPVDGPRHPEPRFYDGGQLYLSFDDDRAIDIEACPKCRQLRPVYDCPAESCRGRRTACRACTLCIARCIGCGCCFDERDFTETFCLDFLCVDCLTRFLNLPDGGEEGTSLSANRVSLRKQESYGFCVYG